MENETLDDILDETLDDILGVLQYDKAKASRWCNEFGDYTQRPIKGDAVGGRSTCEYWWKRLSEGTVPERYGKNVDFCLTCKELTEKKHGKG